MCLVTRRDTMLMMIGMALAPGARATEEKPPKEHKEFHALDMDEGWQPVPGFPAGFDRKLLAGFLDDANKRGSRTTLLRIKPGVFTTAPVIHAFWEEVYVLSGDFITGNDKDGKGGQSFGSNTYACRPPGISHGPFKSETGCVTLELQYYERL
jgi:hypothetical protein